MLQGGGVQKEQVALLIACYEVFKSQKTETTVFYGRGWYISIGPNEKVYKDDVAVNWKNKIPSNADYGVYVVKGNNASRYIAVLPVDEKGEIVYGYYDENCELLQEITDTELTYNSYTPVDGKEVYYVFVPNSVESVAFANKLGVFDNFSGKFGKLKYVLFQDGTALSGRAYCMFYKCTSLVGTNIGTVVNTSGIKDMGYMFYQCSNLTSLDLSNLDTSKVTGMDCMFYKCSGLTSLDLSNFNTSNVTNMTAMFYQCSKLTSLDLSNFNTSNVTNMSYMFWQCSKLTSLDLSDFKTGSVIYDYDSSSYGMVYMFYGCTCLTKLDLSDFDVSNLNWTYAMYHMFEKCFVNNKENNILIINKKALSIITDNRNYSYLVSSTSLDRYSDADLLRCTVTGGDTPKITHVKK